jgi:hypothetical protein
MPLSPRTKHDKLLQRSHYSFQQLGHITNIDGIINKFE